MDVGNYQDYTPPGFLQTCQQIRQDARSIYYSVNTFTFDEPKLWPLEIGMWLDSLDSKHITSVANLLVMSPAVAKSTPTHEAVKKFNELDRQLSDTGIESINGVVTVKVGSIVGKGEGMCCGSGRCYEQGRRRYRAAHVVHYVNRMQLTALIEKEAVGKGVTGE